MKFDRFHFEKLVKGVLVISISPVMVLLIFGINGLMPAQYSAYAIIAVLASGLVFINPYISNITALTDYVKKLASDQKPAQPDLSFLNNLEELSGAVERLHGSWEEKRRQLESLVAENKIVVDILPDALFMLDEKLKVVRTNMAARQLFSTGLAGRTMNEILPAPELSDALCQVLERREKSADIEFSWTVGVPRDFLAQIRAFPPFLPSGTRVILSLHDLTELRKVRKIHADFVANASHEIKTPLSSIIGFIETLKGPARNDDSARDYFLGIMEEQAGKIQRLVEDLLSLSRVEAETSPPRDRVNISHAAIEAESHYRWLISQENMASRITMPENLPPVLGDRRQIIQVISNLIENAIKYGKPGQTVEISAQATEVFAPQPGAGGTQKMVELSVSDSGRGISEEHIPRITERFYRVDHSRTGKAEGAGLGLAIVKHIIARHNGYLKIESKVGQGSKFLVYLPVYEEGA